MKSGGPWNLRGLRPEAREAARDAARRSGVSVGEWLNNVIRDDEDDGDYGEPMRPADYDDEDDEAWRDDKRRESRPDEARRSRYDDRRARATPRPVPEDEPPQRRGARHGHDHDELFSRRRRANAKPRSSVKRRWPARNSVKSTPASTG